MRKENIMSKHNGIRHVQHPAVRRANRLRNTMIGIASIGALLVALASVSAFLIGESLLTGILLFMAFAFAFFGVIIIGIMASDYSTAREEADKVEWDNYQDEVFKLEQENRKQKELTAKILREAGVNIDSTMLENLS